MDRKQFLRYLGAGMGVAALAPMVTACGGGDGVAGAGTAGVSSVSSSTTSTELLSAEEIAGLMFMREEEKLAHDVYVALYEKWGHNVFNQISQSEATHTAAILGLIEAHDLDDPVDDNPPGVFENDDLQALYDKLVAMGQPSLIDALKVGCLIEEKDIKDINDKKALVIDEPDIVTVYDNLLCGSRNHLRAFNDTLIGLGVQYVPTVISQEEWNAIANALHETCGG
jgi:hypothetical protein